MSQYCRDEGMTGDLRDDLFYHVAKLDVAYLKHKASKRKKEPATPATPASKGPKRKSGVT